MIKIPRNIQLPIPEELSPDTALAIVEVAGSTGVAAIKTRTRAGRGIDDNKMKTPSKTPNEQGTYSKAYSDKRADRRVDIRDLTWTGAMVQGVILDRIETTQTGARAVITVTNDQKEKAAFNQVMSPWFGISPQDEQAILAVAEAELQKLLSQA
jgi:hypothetical protein